MLQVHANPLEAQKRRVSRKKERTLVVTTCDTDVEFGTGVVEFGETPIGEAELQGASEGSVEKRDLRSRLGSKCCRRLGRTTERQRQLAQRTFLSE